MHRCRRAGSVRHPPGAATDCSPHRRIGVATHPPYIRASLSPPPSRRSSYPPAGRRSVFRLIRTCALARFSHLDWIHVPPQVSDTGVDLCKQVRGNPRRPAMLHKRKNMIIRKIKEPICDAYLFLPAAPDLVFCEAIDFGLWDERD